jgi:uncharacterized SAM-binding protein YcdF (DUF218 family)
VGEAGSVDGLGGSGGAGGYAGKELDGALGQGGAGESGIGAGDEGEAEEGTGGRAERLGVIGADGAFEEQGAGGSEGFGGADDGAGVAGILQAVEDGDEGAVSEQLFKLPCGWLHQCHHALGGFGGGEALEEAIGKDGEFAAGERGQAAFDGGSDGFGGEDGFHFAAGGEGLLKKVESFSNPAAVRRQPAAGDGSSDVLDQRISGARNRLRLGHLFTIGVRTISIAQMKRAVANALVLALTAALMSIAYYSVRIEQQSTRDEARPADVILVLGAAEYNGRPSPVLRARLDHALELYQKHLAPRIMTTGGAGGDPVFTEGGVGRSYLMSHGVPSEAIVVENEGESTVHSIALAGEIFRRMGLTSIIVVSDGYHIYRVKKMLEARGLTAYGSPRKDHMPELRERWNYFKQAVGYLLWRAGVPV